MAKKAAKQESPEVAILRQGLKSQFWMTLKKLLQDDIDVIAKKILDDDSLSQVPEPMTVRDIARIERKKMVELSEYPEKKIALSGMQSIETDEGDL